MTTKDLIKFGGDGQQVGRAGDGVDRGGIVYDVPPRGAARGPQSAPRGQARVHVGNRGKSVHGRARRARGETGHRPAAEPLGQRRAGYSRWRSDRLTVPTGARTVRAPFPLTNLETFLMKFVNALDLPPPPPPVRVPAMPWHVEQRVYGVPGMQRSHPTKIRHTPNGPLTGEVLDERSEDLAVWEYVCALEAKVKELTIAAQTAVLLAPHPPTSAATDVIGSLPVPAEELLEPAVTLAPLINPTVAPVPGATCADVFPLSTNAHTSPISNATSEAPDVLAPADVADVGDAAPIDKRGCAERELLADPTQPNTVIGEKIGASAELVRKVRLQLQHEGRLQPTAVVRRDGTSYGISHAKDAYAAPAVGDAAASPETP